MRAGIIAAALLGLSLSATALAEPLWVKSSTAILREGKAAVYKPVATLTQGQQVDGIKHDSGWVQINTGSAQGWVSEASVSTSKVNGDINLGGGATAEMSTGAAGRGFNEGAENYMKTRHIDPSRLESLRQIARSIQPEEWLAFSRDVHK